MKKFLKIKIKLLLDAENILIEDVVDISKLDKISTKLLILIEKLLLDAENILIEDVKVNHKPSAVDFSKLEKISTKLLILIE